MLVHWTLPHVPHIYESVLISLRNAVSILFPTIPTVFLAHRTVPLLTLVDIHTAKSLFSVSRIQSILLQMFFIPLDPTSFRFVSLQNTISAEFLTHCPLCLLQTIQHIGVYLSLHKYHYEKFCCSKDICQASHLSAVSQQQTHRACGAISLPFSTPYLNQRHRNETILFINGLTFSN